MRPKPKPRDAKDKETRVQAAGRQFKAAQNKRRSSHVKGKHSGPSVTLDPALMPEVQIAGGIRLHGKHVDKAKDVCLHVARLLPLHDTYVCFTDGACQGNPGGKSGSSAFVVKRGPRSNLTNDTDHTSLTQSFRHATNQIAELVGFELGLRLLRWHYRRDQKAKSAGTHNSAGAPLTQWHIFTDSRYVQGHYTLGWQCHSDNAALIRRIRKLRDDLISELSVSIHIHWTPAHSGVPWNETADALATKARDLGRDERPLLPDEFDTEKEQEEGKTGEKDHDNEDHDDEPMSDDDKAKTPPRKRIKRTAVREVDPLVPDALTTHMKAPGKDEQSSFREQLIPGAVRPSVDRLYWIHHRWHTYPSEVTPAVRQQYENKAGADLRIVPSLWLRDELQRLEVSEEVIQQHDTELQQLRAYQTVETAWKAAIARRNSIVQSWLRTS